METGIFTTGESDRIPPLTKEAAKRLVAECATGQRAADYLDACEDQVARVLADLAKPHRPKRKNEAIEAARRKHAADVVRKMQSLIRQVGQARTALSDNRDFLAGFMLGGQLGELSKVLEVMPHEPMAETGHRKAIRARAQAAKASKKAKQKQPAIYAAVKAEIAQQKRNRVRLNYEAACKYVAALVGKSVRTVKRAGPNIWTPRKE